jgi:hypothetical protein
MIQYLIILSTSLIGSLESYICCDPSRMLFETMHKNRNKETSNYPIFKTATFKFFVLIFNSVGELHLLDKLTSMLGHQKEHLVFILRYIIWGGFILIIYLFSADS